MKLTKKINVMLFAVIALVLSIACITPASAATKYTNYTITAKATTYNPYTPVKQFHGEVRDADGNLAAGVPVIIIYGESYTDIPHKSEALYSNSGSSHYATVSTNAKGEYSVWTDASGFYLAALSTEPNDPRAYDYAYNR